MKTHQKTTVALTAMVLSLSAFATIVQPGTEPGSPEERRGTADAAWPSPPAPAEITVGDIADPTRLSLIAEPGPYGLSKPPMASRYAIIDRQLVRVEDGTGKILSVLREVEAVVP